MSGGWAVYVSQTGAIHILPEDDLAAHSRNPDCWCGPEAISGAGWVHNSKDRREEFERQRS